MQSSIVVNGVEVSLGHRELENVCWMLEDCEKNREIFHEMATSGFVEIRRHIAGCEHLNSDTFKMLLDDSSIEILRSILVNDKAKEWITMDHIKRYLEIGDTEMMVTLVSDVGFYANEKEVCDMNWLCEQLSNHPDPSVRFALAENVDVPIYLLIKLANDDDVEVAAQAKETLSLCDDDDLDEFCEDEANHQ